MSTEAITPEDLLAHSAWLQRLAARLVEPSSAEDLVQETWATAVRAQPDRSRPLRPWLAEVLRNLARMRARGATRWRTRAEKVRAADDVALPTPEELLTYHEAQRMVAEEVAGLQEPFRSAVLLCYGQGMEPSEIARRLSIPAGTVRWRLKRGLDDVRARLDARYGHDRRAWCAALAPVAARGLATSAGAAATIGLRGFGLKAAVAALAVAVLGVAALRWSGSKETGADLAAAGEQEKPQLAPARRVAPAAPSPGGGPGPRRPPNLAPALAGAAAVAPEPGRLDVTEALARAAEPGDSPSRGNPKAPVTIVIYSEFQCPFCSRVNLTLGELQALYPQEVRFVWKHLPLPFHESAGLASEAALAAAEQGKFWPMHDRLFANQDKLDPPSLSEHAQAIGLDVGKFKAALDSGKFRQRIETDLKLAKEASISGTPTFLINGERLVGAQPLPAFKQKVEEALARAKGLPPPKPLAPSGPSPAAAGKPGLPRGPIMGPFWPPARVALPDALLGERLGVPVTIGNAPMKGQAKAPVEVLYFTALASAECTRGAQIAEGLLTTYGQQVRLYAKVMPRVKPGEPGPLVAEAALAAHAAGKFWPFHDAITRGQYGFPDDERIQKAAGEAGLDEGELKAALSSGRHRARALEEGEALRGVRIGEYAFVVNGRVAEGTTALVHLVEAAIKKAGRKPPPWPGPPGAKDPNRLYGLKAPPDAPPVQMNIPFLNLTPRQTFAIEPRDEAWAAPIEKALGPIIEKDLRTVEPKLAGSALECRSTMCRLSWRPGKGDPKLLAGAVSFMYYPVSGGSRPGGPNEHFLLLRTSLAGQERGQTPDSAIATVKSRRNTVLYNVRTGRTNAPGSLPAERLPKE